MVGLFPVWIRPIVGAAAAIAILVLVEANQAFDLLRFGKLVGLRVLLALGLLVGYGERFITVTFDLLSEAVIDKK